MQRKNLIAMSIYKKAKTLGPNPRQNNSSIQSIENFVTLDLIVDLNPFHSIITTIHIVAI